MEDSDCWVAAAWWPLWTTVDHSLCSREGSRWPAHTVGSLQGWEWTWRRQLQLRHHSASPWPGISLGSTKAQFYFSGYRGCIGGWVLVSETSVLPLSMILLHFSQRKGNRTTNPTKGTCMGRATSPFLS